VGTRTGNASWQDSPSTATLITAAKLNAIENVIDASVATTDLPAAIGTAVDVATINNAFGQRAGVPISPWAAAAPAGPELWATSNFNNGGAGYQTASTTPSLVPNGTGQTLITRAKFADIVGGNDAFRIEFDYTLPSNGWAGISLRLVDGSAVQVGAEQWLVTVDGDPDKAGRFIFDFAPGVTSGALYIELKLRTENNANAGSNLAVSNATLRLLSSDSTRPLLVSQQYATGTFPLVYTQQRDVKTDAWKMAEVSFGPEGSLTPFSTMEVQAFYDDQPFVTAPPDPQMKRTGMVVNSQVGRQQVTSGAGVQLRTNNNDQIHTVWNGTAYEYRGNTHGGEFTRTSPGASLKIDRGAGLVSWTLEQMLQGARRFQVIIPSEIRRSTDGTTPYCTVDRTITCFPDGMMRCDRTTTFTQSTQLQYVFEWMSSHDMTIPYVGRIGRGLTVLGETDSHPMLTAPATPSSSTATTGGTLAAATYSYRVTALTPYGESLPSVAKTQATTGSTSTVTVTWSAVTNATGYRIYGRVAGVEKLLGSTTALTFTDTGAVPPLGDLPTVNTARLYNNTTDNTMAQSADATWAVYREPRTGWCFGNIYDRDAALSRTGVTAIHTRLMRGNGIQKNYANLVFGTGTSYTVASGTVWSATHWTYTYLPADPNDYHQEIAVRAASLTALKSIYSNT
jgi:hypothetical protein